MFNKGDKVLLKERVDISKEDCRGGHLLKKNFLEANSAGRIIYVVNPELTTVKRDYKYKWFIVTFEEEDSENFEKGYVYIVLPDYQLSLSRDVKMIEVGRTSRGYTIYRQENGAGGHTYWSDEIGGGVVVWDTCLVDPESLKFCLDYEKYKRESLND